MQQTTLEAELHMESDGWREGYVVRLYPDTRTGLQHQAQEEAILSGHGYLTQSSELAREGSLMVAYVREEEADDYGSLQHPGLEAATDPDSLSARFARPLAWLIGGTVILTALFVLYETLG